MTPEEFRNKLETALYRYDAFGWGSKEGYEYLDNYDLVINNFEKQLQAEKARADKAEEMVAAQESLLDLFQDVLNEKTISEESIKQNWDLCETESIDWVDLWDFVKAFENRETQQTAQARKERLCDELCTRMADKSLEVNPATGFRLHHAIDIVKSVLGGEG